MTSEVFNELLSYIEMDIAEQARVLRETIPAKMKSTGRSFSHLQNIFRIRRTTIG